jgi:N-acetylglucosamine-6-sulfatase
VGAELDTMTPDQQTEPVNVVLLVMDDQHVESLQFMPNVQRLLMGAGTTFLNAFATYPLCGPARATIFTGQYAHNHGVVGNDRARCYGAYDGSAAMPVALQASGYRTAHIGKFMNGYGPKDLKTVPPGWDDWHTSAAGAGYFNFPMSHNGVVETHGDGPEDYHTDVCTRLGRQIIEERAADGTPFLLTISYRAPHFDPKLPRRKHLPQVAQPAPRHDGAFAKLDLPRPPSFNEADVSGKPSFIQERARFGRRMVNGIAASYRSRLESMLAVDDSVGVLIDALERIGQLDRTLVVFTSDHGYFHGEHRLNAFKYYAYEESVRIPMIVRGPGFPAGRQVATSVANIDVAPTIHDVTGVPPMLEADGISMAPLAAGAERERDILLETMGSEENPIHGRAHGYVGVRTSRYVYVEYTTDELELYDLQTDPYQLHNRIDDPSLVEVRETLESRLEQLRDCAGPGCNA